MPKLVGAAAIAGFFVLALVASGCGGSALSADSTTSSSEAVTPVPLAMPGPTSVQDVPKGISSNATVMFLGADEPPPSPVADLYAVFRRPPRAADLAVQKVARMDGLADEFDIGPSTGSPPEPSLGKPLYEKTRLILGMESHGVYAVPTTTDSVCSGQFPDGAGGCGQPGPHGITMDYGEASSELLIYGLIGDDVEGVDAVVDGMTRPAELAENAYLLRLSQVRSANLDVVVLHLRDGGSDELPLSGIVGQSIQP